MKRGIVAAILLAVFALFLFIIYQHQDKSPPTRIKIQRDTLVEMPEIKKIYGVPEDSFHIEQGRVKYNQTLALLLRSYDMPAEKVYQVALSFSEVFDTRKFKRGNYYYCFFSKDTLRTMDYFVYEIDPVNYVRVNLRDSIYAVRGEKEVTSLRKAATGVINSSLWSTMADKNQNPELALELSEIFAWTINFFRINKGDEYKVIYEEQFIDTVSIGIGKIHAACIRHMGKDHYALAFSQSENNDYFDEQGNSLRRTFLKAPLRYSRISSGYSYSRFHPILKVRRPHRGVDYAAATGTPILSIGDGVISRKGYTKGAGYYIKVRHNSVYTSGYNHLSKYPRKMGVGKKVKQGDIIGYVGSTGYATGPHLDFRVWKNGYPINPLNLEAPPVEPISEENLDTFNTVKSKYLVALDSLHIN